MLTNIRKGIDVRFRLLLCAMVWLVATPARAADAEPAYVTDAACAACHPDVQGPYSHTVHAKLFNPQNAITAEMKLGCEGCHGPASLHVEGGGKIDAPGFVSFKAASMETIEIENGVCLGCHQRGKQTLWKGSIHQIRDVACSSCHEVMQVVSDRHLLQKKDQVDTCAGCHPTIRAQLYRRSHMPLQPGFLPDREGKMECSSCHNPHGTVSEHLLAANTVNDGCYECHAEKRGPFMHEHAPVTENCLNCHQPHGSTQPFMLKQAMPRLCQQCHIFTRHPSNPYAPTSRDVVQQGCLNCHVNIHGSNHPSGEFFVR